MISRLDRGELTREEAALDVRSVLARCDELRAETDGYFDAAFGGQLDPSGSSRAGPWTALRRSSTRPGSRTTPSTPAATFAFAAAPGPTRRGASASSSPLSSGEIAAVVVGTDLAVATSGEYARGKHIVDPHSGEPPRGTLSVTFAGSDLATADAYATAAFAMGEEGPRWAATRLGYESLTILADGRVLMTPGFPRG